MPLLWLKVTFLCRIILTSHGYRRWPLGEMTWFRNPKRYQLTKVYFKFTFWSLHYHGRAVFIHLQLAVLPGGTARSGASLTSAAANHVASFRRERRAVRLARKLRAIACHVTRQTSALLVRNGAKGDDWISYIQVTQGWTQTDCSTWPR